MVAAMILIVAACGNGVTDSTPRRLIRVNGNVFSAATQAPIQGAQVTLTSVGFPSSVVASTTTATAGNYSLEYHARVISGGCGTLILSVVATGFQSPGRQVLCIDELQTFHFALQPG